MLVRIRNIAKADHPLVIQMLQDISSYYPDEADFETIWATFNAQPHVHGLVAVAEDTDFERLIGYGALCVDMKIRGGAIGHIEDVVVAPDFRGKGLGKMIVRALVALAGDLGCYKVSLECREERKDFYAEIGFVGTGCAMSLLLPSAAQ